MRKNNIKLYLINISIVLFIFIISLYLCKIYPFGKNSIAICDGIYQFEPFLYDYIIKIKKGIFTIYSFNNGLGNPFIFNYIYYLSSPINIIAFLFNSPDAMYLAVIITKIIITSITMTLYAKSKTDNNYYITIATISYTFCSWFITYHFYLSWLDTFMIFPLLIYGLDKLLKEKKHNTYILSLCYLIISNFYFVIPTFLYITIYTIYYLITNKEDRIKTIKKFIIANLITIGITSIFIFICYDTFKRTGLFFDKMNYAYNTNIKQLLSSIIYGNNILLADHYGTAFPNIACNIIITSNIILIFLSDNKIINKIKIFLLIIIIIFIIVNPLSNYILNMFHNIRGLPYRYAFIIVFIEIQLFLTNHNINKDIVERIKIFITLIILFLILLYLNTNKIITNRIFYTNIIIIICYSIYILLYSNNKYHKSLLVLLISLESILSITTFFERFPEDYKKINKYNNTNTSYRLGNNNLYYYYKYSNKFYQYNSNINLYNNQKSINTNTSISYNSISILLKNLGEKTYNNSFIQMKDYNTFVNILFNIKGPNYLEKIYSVNKNIKKVKIENDQIVKNINSIASAISKENNIFNKKEIKANKNGSINYYYNQSFYFIVDNIDNKGIIKNDIYDTPYFYYYSNKYNNNITVYEYNYEKINKIYNSLKDKNIKYKYYNDDLIIGNIKVDKDELIFTSIPYDTNWQIYIDNKKVKPIKLLDSLIGIEVKEGNHKIELKYKYNNYLIPSLISILFLILFIKSNNKIS